MEERKLEVLRAIVEDFVATEEPVGSKSLAERHNLGVSPATVRNDPLVVASYLGTDERTISRSGRVPS